MKTKIFSVWIFVAFLLASCQTAVPTSPASTPTPPGQMETRVAATIYAGQTSAAGTEQAQQATLTAAVPPPTNTPTLPLTTDTPVPTPTPNRFHFSLQANACWVNSEVNVRNGQTVVIRASGWVNTWDGRDGSNGDPNGQKGVCGAIQCPLQGTGYGALIGRLENLPPFFVGTMYRFTATKDGQLYFTVNDWTCDDNSGVFDILVTFP